MRFVTSALDATGAALVVAGVALWSIPAALVAAGVGCLFVSWRAVSESVEAPE